jgi:uncharacterized RDD family membrane protein YckC
MQSQTQVQYAGFWMRFLAYVIDYMIVGAVQTIIGLIAGIFLGLSGVIKTGQEMDPGTAALVTGIFFGISGVIALLTLIYFAAFESSSCQGTPGKMAMGLIVTNEDGSRVSFGQALGRNLGKIISGLILCIGYMLAGWTERRQALHDIMARCLVVRKPREKQAEALD